MNDQDIMMNNLEARIAKAIKENTCPYTTDADIRYFETEEYISENADMCICGEPDDITYFEREEYISENADMCICGKSLENTEELYLQAQYDKEMVNYSEPVSFDMWKAAKAVIARYEIAMSERIDMTSRIRNEK
jgi:hypothetical protein